MKNKKIKFKFSISYIAGKYLFTIQLILISIIVYPQEKKVSINKKNASIEEVLKEIQKQTGLNYFLNHEEIPEET